jgi:hypothetical protein
MKFWWPGQNNDAQRGLCELTFTAGSCVFEKEASWTGLLREFVMCGETLVGHLYYRAETCGALSSGGFPEEGSQDSDASK